MELVKIEMTKEQIGNLMVFLDRVSYKGFGEVGVIQGIIVALQSPIQENVVVDSVE